MRLPEQALYENFYATFEKVKFDREITFENVFRQIFEKTKRVEVSFSSKMIATIRPELPVFDSYLRENLSLKVPRAYIRCEVRVEEFIVVYGVLCAKMLEMIRDPGFSGVRTRFDAHLPDYSHFTDMKKLDLLLWQSR